MKHLVLCAFLPDLDPTEVIADFAALATTVPSVRAIDHGVNVSPEGLADGFTHCFALDFDSAADRDAYLVDPAHLAFVERFTPTLEKILVFDYETAPAQVG
jgi:hypothetical protein